MPDQSGGDGEQNLCVCVLRGIANDYGNQIIKFE